MLLLSFFVLTLTATAVAALAVSDALQALVDYQFEHHHDEWVACGRPAGGAMTRREQSFWFSGFTNSRVLREWLFQSPPWASTNAVPLRLLRRLRLAGTGLFISVEAMVVAGALCVLRSV